METAFGLLVFLAISTPLLGGSPFSGKCYKYRGLLDSILPLDYVENPVKNLKQVYVTINLDGKPDEKYYLSVLKTYDAYERGIIRPVQRRTLSIHKDGIRSEVYQTAPGYFENRLISHSDIGRARSYFTKRAQEVCGAEPDHKVHETVPTRGTEDVGIGIEGDDRRCLRNGQIRDFESQMRKINLNSEPGASYYKLVLKINRAVYCKQLTVIEGTLVTGALGVKTEEYFGKDDHRRLRLASIEDRRLARAFFKERRQKNQVVGTSLVAPKAGQYISDKRDNRHDLGGSKLIPAPVLPPRTPISDRQLDIPMYPLKDQRGVPTHTIPTATLPTTLFNRPLPTSVANPINQREPSSLVTEEDVKVRVKVETEVSVRRKQLLRAK